MAQRPATTFFVFATLGAMLGVIGGGAYSLRLRYDHVRQAAEDELRQVQTTWQPKDVAVFSYELRRGDRVEAYMIRQGTLPSQFLTPSHMSYGEALKMAGNTLLTDVAMNEAVMRHMFFLADGGTVWAPSRGATFTAWEYTNDFTAGHVLTYDDVRSTSLPALGPTVEAVFGDDSLVGSPLISDVSRGEPLLVIHTATLDCSTVCSADGGAAFAEDVGP